MSPQSINLSQKLQAARQHLVSGNNKKAARLCAEVLEVSSDNAEANHLAGFIECQSGNPERGILQIRRAIELKPDHAKAHYNLGNALRDRGDLQAAAACFRAAHALLPAAPNILNNLGNVLSAIGQLDEAVGSFRKALASSPNYAMAYMNLGSVLRKQGQLDEAEACFRKAISLKADIPEAHSNLGLLLSYMGNAKGAIASFQHALSLQSNNAVFHFNLGIVLKKIGELSESISCFRNALAINPNFSEAYVCLGRILYDNDSFEEAKNCFQKAIVVNPANILAYSGLAKILMGSGEVEAAVENWRAALAYRPDLRLVHSNLLLALNKIPGVPQQEMYDESRQWNEQYCGSLPALPLDYENSMAPERCLRVGYVSADFNSHSMSFLIEPLVKAHHRESVEVYCYANVPIPDEVTKSIKSSADHWRPIDGLQDEEVAAQIHKDKIDILVDLSGHTTGNRLLVFARKPAPVQITWLGYTNTTGLPAMDYHLADQVVMPDGADEYFSESAFRLSKIFFCYKTPADSPDVQDGPLHATSSVTFGSVNSLVKLNPAVIESWSRILTEVKGSRLLLQSRKLNDPYIKNRYLSLFAEHSIGPERIEIVAGLSRADFLKIHNRIDICLDPFPFNGLFTTCDSLWMGVPVITLRGNRYAGRMASSALTCLGLQELIADSMEEYLEKAVILAGNHESLAALRHTLRDRMRRSPICDADVFARSVEKAYSNMWKAYVAKNS